MSLKLSVVIPTFREVRNLDALANPEALDHIQPAA